MKRGRTPQPSC